MTVDYLEAAEAAFANAQDLLGEAKLLLANKKWARSYALSLLAGEQYVRSIQFKAKWAGCPIPPDSGHAKHKHRLSAIAAIILMNDAWVIEGKNFFMQFIDKSIKKEKPSPDFVKKVKMAIQHGKEAKEAGFYVDERGGKLETPWEKIRPYDALFVLELMIGAFAHPILRVKTSKEDFCATLKVYYGFLETRGANEFISKIEGAAADSAKTQRTKPTLINRPRTLAPSEAHSI